MRPENHRMNEAQRLVYLWLDCGRDHTTLASVLGLHCCEISRAKSSSRTNIVKTAQVWLRLAEVMRVPLADLVTFVATGTMTPALLERIVK